MIPRVIEENDKKMEKKMIPTSLDIKSKEIVLNSLKSNNKKEEEKETLKIVKSEEDMKIKTDLTLNKEVKVEQQNPVLSKNDKDNEIIDIKKEVEIDKSDMKESDVKKKYEDKLEQNVRQDTKKDVKNTVSKAEKNKGRFKKIILYLKNLFKYLNSRRGCRSTRV